MHPSPYEGSHLKVVVCFTWKKSSVPSISAPNSILCKWYGISCNICFINSLHLIYFTDLHVKFVISIQCSKLITKKNIKKSIMQNPRVTINFLRQLKLYFYILLFLISFWKFNHKILQTFIWIEESFTFLIFLNVMTPKKEAFNTIWRLPSRQTLI